MTTREELNVYKARVEMKKLIAEGWTKTSQFWSTLNNQYCY